MSVKELSPFYVCNIDAFLDYRTQFSFRQTVRTRINLTWPLAVRGGGGGGSSSNSSNRERTSGFIMVPNDT